jgi:hypothetical protein
MRPTFKQIRNELDLKGRLNRMLSESEQIAALDRIVTNVKAREALLHEAVMAGIAQLSVAEAYVYGVINAFTINKKHDLDSIPESNEVPDDEKDAVYDLCYRQHVRHRLFRQPGTSLSRYYRCSCGDLLRFAHGTIEASMKARGHK